MYNWWKIFSGFAEGVDFVYWSCIWRGLCGACKAGLFSKGNNYIMHLLFLWWINKFQIPITSCCISKRAPLKLLPLQLATDLIVSQEPKRVLGNLQSDSRKLKAVHNFHTYFPTEIQCGPFEKTLIKHLLYDYEKQSRYGEYVYIKGLLTYVFFSSRWLFIFESWIVLGNVQVFI